MCGILGYYNLRGEPVRLSEPEILRMRDTMSHRGPDACGYLEAADRSWTLAHRRLSIIDLSPQGHQPMSDQAGAIHVCYNGEIYNFRELRAELESAGVRFRSTSDTEVLVHMYRTLGTECFARLRGMFAVIVVDEARRQAVIARDPLGKKPLYYAVIGDEVVIASDPGVISRHPGYRKEVSPAGLYYLLTMGGIKSPETLFAGIYKLEPGCLHVLKAGFRADQAPERYHRFQVVPKKQIRDDESALQTLDELLERAVERRMISDVPFGVYLSGGIDSALIVSYMSNYVDRVNTFSIDLQSSNRSKKEAADADRVARQFKTNHRLIEMSDEEYIEILDTVVLRGSGPAIPDSVLLARLSRAARESGVIVIETGEGADEVFFGYQDYLAWINNGYRKFNTMLSPLPRPLATFAMAVGPSTAINRFSYAVDSIDMRANRCIMSDFLYQPFFSYQANRLASRYLGRAVGFSKFRTLNDAITTRLPDRRDYLPATMSVLWHSSYRWGDFLLDRVDRFTMSSGVEGRAPFLDVDVVNFGFSLVDGWKARQSTSKYILRRLAETRISAEHAALPKRGFGGGNDNMLSDRTCAFMRGKLAASPSYRDRPLVDLDRIANRSQLFTVTTFHSWIDTWMS